MLKNTSLVFSVVCLVFLSDLSVSSALVVRGEPVQFSSDMVRFPEKNTFVITGFPGKRKRACDSGLRSNFPVPIPPVAAPVGQSSVPQSVSSCQLPVPHFALGSSNLSHKEVDQILIDVKQCNLDLNKPLHIIGHACKLGKDQKNQMLSLQRSQKVAAVLRKHGYTIGEVKGEGSQYPVTTDERLMHLNRRVEINN